MLFHSTDNNGSNSYLGGHHIRVRPSPVITVGDADYPGLMGGSNSTV